MNKNSHISFVFILSASLLFLSMPGCSGGGSAGTSGECSSNDSCDEGMVCVYSECRQICLINTDCENGFHCEEGLCVGEAAICGNGIVERGETCDNNCPMSCSDGNACTQDIMSGSMDSCDVFCLYPSVEACIGGDGCCPAMCIFVNDSDCSDSCGDNIVDDDETCDANCPTAADCVDTNACTADAILGSAANCSAQCINTDISACVSDDGCCPSGCDATTDNDCGGVCGNDEVEGSEICDGDCPTLSDCSDGVACTTDGLTGSSSTCNAECVYSTILDCIHGDGCCPRICDNSTDNDCSASCGNLTVEGNETCDGNCPTSCDDYEVCTSDELIGSSSSCSAECINTDIVTCIGGDGCCPSYCNATNDVDCAATCGNNIVESGETCDGNCPTSCSGGSGCITYVLSGSACTRECVSSSITNCINSDGCCPSGCNTASYNLDNDCSPVCGNGLTESGEACDASCPTSCNDGNSCTSDTLLGAPCNKYCSYLAVTSCTSNDGCAKSGCDITNDNDWCPSCSLDSNGISCPTNCVYPAPSLCGVCAGCSTSTSSTTNPYTLRYGFCLLFDRKPDTSGYTYWLGGLNGGTKRWAVLHALLESPEFSSHNGLSPTISAMSERQYIAFFYTFFFNKTATTADIDWWDQSSANKTAVTQHLATSSEFQTKHPPLYGLP